MFELRSNNHEKVFSLLLLSLLKLRMAHAQKFDARLGIGGGLSISSAFECWINSCF